MKCQGHVRHEVKFDRNEAPQQPTLYSTTRVNGKMLHLPLGNQVWQGFELGKTAVMTGRKPYNLEIMCEGIN